MTIHWLNRLTKPLAYLRIQHTDKRKYDWGIPICLTVITMGVFGLLGYSVPLFGQNGIFASVSALAHVLVGFFIAALAAVATFPKASLDDEMSNPPPMLKDRYKGHYHAQSYAAAISVLPFWLLGIHQPFHRAIYYRGKTLWCWC